MPRPGEQRAGRFLDPRPGGVEQPDHRHPLLERELAQPGHLDLAGHPHRAGHDREVVGGDRARAALDVGPARDHAVGRRLLALHRLLREVRAGMDAHLDERAGVDEQVDPLARGQLAALVLLRDLLLAPAELRLRAPLVELARRLRERCLGGNNSGQSSPSAPGVPGVSRGGASARFASAAASATFAASSVINVLSIGFALLEERGHALDRVLGRELDRKLRPQVIDRVGERHVELAPHRVLAELHHQRPLRRRASPAQSATAASKSSGGDDPVDDARLARLLGAQPLAEQQHLRRLLPRHVAVDQRHDHEREQADVDLGRAEPGALLGDDQVARERDAERAGEHVPVRGDDRRLSELAERDEDLREEARREVLVRGRRVGRETAEVAAGREHLLVRGGEDDDADVVVRLRVRERREQLGEQRVGERVARLGIVEGDRRDVLGDFVADLLVGHAPRHLTASK